MIELTGTKPEGIEKAKELREKLFKNLPLVLAGPHVPQLTQSEKDKVIDKLVYLANHEYRAAYYSMFYYVCDLEPGTPERPAKLSKTVLHWSGKMTRVYTDKPVKKKAPCGKNGRIIRSSKGL